MNAQVDYSSSKVKSEYSSSSKSASKPIIWALHFAAFFFGILSRLRPLVTDSKRAHGGYRKWVISSEAAATLTKSRAPERAVELIWVSAHTEMPATSEPIIMPER